MKVVILAGGLGTRISEESYLKPKPMVEVGEFPILWHIMKTYAHYGFDDFIICLGYKGYVIKEYFANYYLHQSDVTFDFANENKMVTHNHSAEPWKVTLVNTGGDTMTGGRLKRLAPYLDKNEPFMVTYGDGVSNVNIPELVKFHKEHGKLATVTSVRPLSRFGILDVNDDNEVTGFREKPPHESAWISGGFFVMNPKVLDYIEGDTTVFEQEPLNKLTADNQLSAYKHTGFWYAMDTLRDKMHLDKLWKNSQAPWKIWDKNSEYYQEYLAKRGVGQIETERVSRIPDVKAQMKK